MNRQRKTLVCTAALIMVCVLTFSPSFSQSQPASQAASKPVLAEEAFKNVQVLRGIPAKEFMETMGFFAASLAMTCTDCHSDASGSSWANYADETPRKQTARRMVLMVNAINAANFGGARSVTCYTCHRTAPRPKVIPSLAAQYAEPPEEDPDEAEILPGARVTMQPEQILDRYVQALGGAAALSRLTSFTAKGTYEGFDSDFFPVPLDLYAKAPDMRTTVVHMGSGNMTNTYDGREAWAAAPPDLVPLPLLQLVGQNMQAARLEALLAFPGQLKQALTGWQGGFLPVTIDGRTVDIIAGKMPDGSRVKLYFDKQSGLLVRQVRYVNTAVGTIPSHVTYSDYRTISGVKIPFEWQVTWVDGQSTIKLTSLQPNASISEAIFAKPSPPPARASNP